MNKNQYVTDTVQQIEKMDSKSMTLNFPEPKAHSIRQSVRRHLTAMGIGDNIVLSLRGKSALEVYKKEKTYVQKLEDMVRDLMMKVDDDELYEKAFALLFGGK